MRMAYRAQQSLAKRKLDCLGYVRGACGFANDEERKRRLTNQLNLVASLGEIAKAAATEQQTKKSNDTSKLLELAPAAVSAEA